MHTDKGGVILCFLHTCEGRFMLGINVDIVRHEDSSRLAMYTQSSSDLQQGD